MAKHLTNFMIDPELSEGLKRIKERDGIPEGEQIRRGIRMWLAKQGIRLEAEGKRRAVLKSARSATRKKA